MSHINLSISHSDRTKSLILYGPTHVTVRCPRPGGILELDLEIDAFLDMIVRLPDVQSAQTED